MSNTALLPSHLHGHSTVAILVGPSPNPIKFTIHKGLLCAKSTYFSAVFNGPFSESSTLISRLPEQDPQAFEVVYQWLYSGTVWGKGAYSLVGDQVATADETLQGGNEERDQEEDLFWLNVIKLADMLQLQALLLIAYQNLRELHNDSNPTIPSVGFLEGLYDCESPQSELQGYIAGHVAYWIMRPMGRSDRDRDRDGAGDARDWQPLIESNLEFSRDVLRRLTDVFSEEWKGWRGHPVGDRGYDGDVLFSGKRGAMDVDANRKDVEEKERDMSESVSDD